ncbi:hypothetical protein ATANTOWER_009498 [Ataeniobius toweri]|uniref:Uncharacterized protein n=1 Tax=Ataeniobius toweri TaxID=208326 RepID=A0ABU7ANQ0_9TELE|nr:hypothetical protein [Ataeniobius toweri]
MAGALLRNCGTSILRLMLHVEWSCGSQPWILNPSSSDSYFRTSINRPPLQSPTASSSLPALHQPPPTAGATAGPSASPPQAPRLREVPSPPPEHYSGHVDHSLGFSTHHLRTTNSGPPLTGRLCKFLPLPPACLLSNKLLRHHLRTLWTPGSQTQIVPETLPRSLPPGDTKPEDRTPTT